MDDPIDLVTFRQTIRDFMQRALPPDIRDAVRAGRQLSRERLSAWHNILADAAYLVAHWPVVWGGRGWSVAQQMVFAEAGSVMPLLASDAYHRGHWQTRVKRRWGAIFD